MTSDERIDHEENEVSGEMVHQDEGNHGGNIIEEPGAYTVRGCLRKFDRTFKDLWLVTTRYLLSYRIVAPMMKDTITFLEYAGRKLRVFLEKYHNFSDIECKDLFEFLRSSSSELLEFLTSEKVVGMIENYLSHIHKLTLQGLDCAGDVSLRIVPVTTGVKEMYERNPDESSIVIKSYCLLINFFYRSLQKMADYMGLRLDSKEIVNYLVFWKEMLIRSFQRMAVSLGLRKKSEDGPECDLTLEDIRSCSIR